ncbi:hypothetical protein CJ030_MR4G025291 [Morella rubra]|uniref:Uncharacterized protein n=1 Tax=Morella rubra TaxID=262757 RepID=A0A6A1VRU8_9ROSI|nr:hypothetical protein CJ030_MR4G025291 [Morella rubra]
MLLSLIKKMKRMEEDARKRKTKDKRLLLCRMASWIMSAAIICCLYVRCVKMEGRAHID